MPWWGWLMALYGGAVLSFVVYGFITEKLWMRRREVELSREVEEWLKQC